MRMIVFAYYYPKKDIFCPMEFEYPPIQFLRIFLNGTLHFILSHIAHSFCPIISEMPRRYRRRFRNRDKYSVEQTIINTPNSSAWELFPSSGDLAATRQVSYSVLPPTEVQGMRKVKHFTLTFTATQDVQPYYYALVFVPAGYEPQRINLPDTGLAINGYDANQFVISQGVLDFSGGPLRIRSPLSRNLNSGDSIYLLLATYDGVEAAILASVRYAITLQ